MSSLSRPVQSTKPHAVWQRKKYRSDPEYRAKKNAYGSKVARTLLDLDPRWAEIFRLRHRAWVLRSQIDSWYARIDKYDRELASVVKQKEALEKVVKRIRRLKEKST